jgi:hypothetical protein
MGRCRHYLEIIAAGKAEEAVTGLLREMSTDPGYKGGIFILSLAFDAMGHRELAQEIARLYLELEPSGYWASNACAKLLEWDADANQVK